LTFRLTWWLGFMAAFALLAGLVSQVGVLRPVEDAMLTAISPLQSAARAVFDPVADFMANFGNTSDLRQENAELRAELDRLSGQLAQAQVDASRARDLESQLGIVENNPQQTFLPAEVVQRDTSAFRDEITLNKGSNDGVGEGMVVLSNGGAGGGSLAGVVVEVLPNHAVVRLITDPRSDVPAIIHPAGQEGIIKGGVSGQLALDLIPSSVTVSAGDQVATSGLGGDLPAGLAIGQVVRVEGTTLDIFKEITVEPVTKLASVRDVLILTSFTPERIGAR
jgi:rod shape-determining protein MreC